MSSPNRRFTVSRKHPNGVLFAGRQKVAMRRPQAGRSLAETAAAFIAVFENGTAGIVETEVASARFVRVNRRYCEITGRSEAELLGGLGPRDVLHPADYPAIERSRAAASTNASWDTDLRYLRPDGTVVWARASIVVSARDRQGAPVRVIILVHDITESRVAAERLRASEALLRLSMQVGHIGTFGRDLATGAIQCGPETRILHGLPPGDNTPVPFEQWFAVVLPEDRERVRRQISDALAGGLSEVAFRYRYRHPNDGKVRHMEARARYQYDAEGRSVSSVGVLIDVTAAREAEELLHLSLRAGRVGWFRHDYVTRTYECGLETRAMRFLPPGDGPISEQDWFESVLPEDRELLQAQVLRSQARHDGEASFGYRVRNPVTGRLHYHTVRGQFEYGADGSCVSALGALIDVTELREAEAMLRLTLEVGRVGTFRHDFVAESIECCPVTRAIYGMPANQAVLSLQTWFGFIVAKDRERLLAAIAEWSARQQAEVSHGYRIFNPVDGRVRHIEARVRFEYDADGRCLHALGVLIDVTEQREAETRIAHLAHHDALTGLPNRLLFRERLDRALAVARRGAGFALLLVDLDYFKEVNDTLGHPVGDALLQAVAGRMQAELRETDTLARLGGDEFAVIAVNVAQPQGATIVARRLVEVLAAPFDLDGQQVVIGGSIGITLAPADGLDADGLLKGADMALYCAKAEGRGGWCFFEPEMDARMHLRRALELDLRRALAMNEFELFYQPVVEIRSRRVVGLEALLRWRHPERGLVLPDAFIPLAEEIGLIVPIGELVLTRACTDTTTWPGSPKVAVNLSPVQFTSRGLVDAVATALEMSGLDPTRLELEVTERVLLRDTQATVATLHRLRGLGVRLAMDDFGTGYSSLSYLQRFPFDKVKIDRSFTSGLEQLRQSNAIVHAIVDLCAGLGMITTAEGVETEAQFDILQRAGCDEAQGYLFSRPRPAGEIAALLGELASDRCASLR